MRRRSFSHGEPDPYDGLEMWPPETEARRPISHSKRVVLFSIGIVLGALLFLIGGISWQPAAPECHGCAIVNSTIHSSDCTQAVQGGWVCEGH